MRALRIAFAALVAFTNADAETLSKEEKTSFARVQYVFYGVADLLEQCHAELLAATLTDAMPPRGQQDDLWKATHVPTCKRAFAAQRSALLITRRLRDNVVWIKGEKRGEYRLKGKDEADRWWARCLGLLAVNDLEDGVLFPE